jgi:hypothetical protein
MTTQWMKNPSSFERYLTLVVTIYATWNFLQLLAFCQLSKVIIAFAITCVYYN